MRRFALIALLLLAAVDTAAWWVATDRLRAGYERWQTSLPPHGWRVESESPIAGGWPLAARLRLRHARLGQTEAGGFAWSADAVTFGMSLLHPKTLVVAPTGTESLAGPGLPAILFHADTLAAAAPLGGRITAARADAARLVVETPAGEAVATAAHVDAAWTAGALHVRATAGPIALPARRRWGLGQTVTGVSLDAVAHGAWPAGAARDAAARWRDAGGTIDIVRVAGQWGTLDLHGSGAAALDADLQPTGTLALTVIDPQAAIATLAEAGAIGRGAATAAGAVLGLMVLPARLAGQPAVLDLPLRLDAGTLSLGQIPLARVPAVKWP